MPIFSSIGGGYDQSRSFVDPKQQKFLQDVYGLGRPLYDQTGPASFDFASDFFSRFSPALQQGQETLMGLADPTSQIAAQEQSLQAGLGRLFNEQIMPGIQSDAIAAGAFGGGRQGVAEGVAAGQLGSAYAEGLGAITAAANAQAYGAANSLPGYGQQVMNLGLSPYQAAWAPAMNYARLIGAPTVLQESEAAEFNIGFA